MRWEADARASLHVAGGSAREAAAGPTSRGGHASSPEVGAVEAGIGHRPPHPGFVPPPPLAEPSDPCEGAFSGHPAFGLVAAGGGGKYDFVARRQPYIADPATRITRGGLPLRRRRRRLRRSRDMHGRGERSVRLGAGIVRTRRAIGAAPVGGGRLKAGQAADGAHDPPPKDVSESMAAIAGSSSAAPADDLPLAAALEVVLAERFDLLCSATSCSAADWASSGC
eukprot:CAMPEP_0176099994 /NCGR_PEP_ID=MMETSP0120_2-20121206/50152_1 /TAXON_ID=160619 /ORGANISM="Kryptoperidinium foliaceum, Strain CCMP 1326" /LENGTH=224 /DNA_ID=CAMNT_0017434037 /DNA_START=59 /DNA_END=733 /DNA_ORIENTATION=+